MTNPHCGYLSGPGPLSPYPLEVEDGLVTQAEPIGFESGSNGTKTRKMRTGEGSSGALSSRGVGGPGPDSPG